MTKKVTEAGAISRRRLLTTAGAGAALAASPLGINLLQAQSGPIRIGMSMPQTGGLAGGGKPSLLGIEIWRDDVNAKGAGEAGTAGAAAAVSNAVNDALQPFGAIITEIPLTPQVILTALGRI